MASSLRLQNFYKKADKWRTLRLSLILERGNRCQICEKIGFDSADLVGHHSPIELTDENVDDAMISLNPDNILIVCRWCHDAAHTRFGSGQKQVYLVWGSPQSGKSTYVMAKKKANDLIVDMNMLYQSVTGYSFGNKPNSLKRNVLRLRDTLIDMIKVRHGDWGTAWIVGEYGDRYKREIVTRDTGAELIHIDTSKDECIKRLKANDVLKFRQNEWMEYIEKYWEDYSE